ncbi:MAG: hypothetical protein LC122_12550 [Chitinophagales bacterium]|nr:hypothetical protein [Chitinophagales bacterium]
MRLLVCPVCEGEMEVFGHHLDQKKKVKCTYCGFKNFEEKKQPVVVYNKRQTNNIEDKK